MFYYRNRLSVFKPVRWIFSRCTKHKIKKVIQDFFFSDLRAGGTKGAGDVTVENFANKVDQTLHKTNTYHSPRVNHAWKWPQKILCGPPWPSFFIDFRNLSSDLTRRDRKKTWTGAPTVLKDPGFGIIRPSWTYKSVLRIFVTGFLYELWPGIANRVYGRSCYRFMACTY